MTSNIFNYKPIWQAIYSVTNPYDKQYTLWQTQMTSNIFCDKPTCLDVLVMLVAAWVKRDCPACAGCVLFVCTLPSAPGQLWPCSSYCEKSPSTVCDVVWCTTRARSPALGGRRAATGKGQQGFPRTQPTTVQCPVTTTTKTTIKNTKNFCKTRHVGTWSRGGLQGIT